MDDILDSIAKKLFNEVLQKGTIDEGLYNSTADELLKALHRGLGGTTFAFDDSRNTLKAYLEQNLYAFSAAKSTAELEHFRALLSDPEGKLRTFTEFRNAVFEAGYEFNVTFLKTEYNTAIAATQAARQWLMFIDTGVEELQYSTVGDDKVRPAHRELDGFTAKISDPIWSLIYPPNDWNCRCWVIPGLKSNLDKVKIDKVLLKENIPLLFQKNVGASKVIYDDNNPYYKVGNYKQKELQAERNYGMPSIQSIYKRDLPPKIEVASKEEFNQWWKDIAGSLRKEIIIKDVNGVNVQLDNEFRTHVTEANSENRWSYLPNVTDVLQNPDEVWSLRNNDELDRYYIKYYKNYPIVVMVNADDGIRAFTMYEIQRNGKINIEALKALRRGILIYR